MSIRFNSSSLKGWLGEIYNKWIVILQEFDLEFVSEKSKKSLIFVELISYFQSEDEELVCEDTFIDEHIFLISTLDHGMGILLYIYKHWRSLLTSHRMNDND